MFEKDYENELFIEPIAGGVRLRLPRRALGKARHLGWVLLGVGLIGGGFMAAWMGFPISKGIELLREGELFGWGLIAFGLLGTLGLAPLLWSLSFGLTILLDRTRCTIDIDREMLVVRENMLVGSWRQKRPLAQIEQLRIGPALQGTSERAQEDGLAKIESTALDALGSKTLLALHATGSGMKPVKIAGGYALELLEKVAKELAPRIEADLELRHLGAGGHDDSRPREAVFVQTAGDSSVEEKSVYSHAETEEAPKYSVPEQPAESTATIDRHEGGVVITCPPLGVWKGSKGLWVFALLWNGIIGLFLVMLTGVTLGMTEMESDTPLWAAWLFMTPFVAIGAGIVALIFYTGTVRTKLATAGGRLLMARESCFGRKVQEWAGADLKSIRLGASGTEVNKRPVMELQIQPRRGNKIGLLSERKNEELAWIAAELTRALDLLKGQGPGGVPQAERDDEGRLVVPPETKLAIHPQGAGWEIAAPPGAAGTWISLVVIGVIFTAIAAGATVMFAMNGVFRGMGIFFLLLWLPLFSGAGLGMLLGGLVALRRRYTVVVEPMRLEVLRRGLFGSKRFEWPVEQVTKVAVINSGTKVNNRALKQIKVTATGGGVKMMTGHSEEELAYVVELIRETLGIVKPEYATVNQKEVKRLEPW